MRRLMAQMLLICSCELVSAHAQDVMQVSAKAIQQHIDHRAFPVYPAIAKAAHIQGTVLLDLRVGITGKIKSLKAVSGPPMLQQAAIDCVKQWTFHPFEKDGIPVVAIGQYSIIFTLGDEGNATKEAIKDQGASPRGPVKTVIVHVSSENTAKGPNADLNDKFDDADSACKRGVLSRQLNGATVSACKDAAELAEQLPVDENYVATRSAFVYAATAYGDIRDLGSALSWAEKAVEVVKLGHDDVSGSEAAYSTKGTIEGLMGDLAASDRDMTLAEGFGRTGLAQAEKESSGIKGEYSYSQVLLRDLRFHAKVLQALNEPDEAKKKLDEAEKLK